LIAPGADNPSEVHSVPFDKTELLAAFRAHLEAQRADLVRSRDDARGGTRVDGTHRPENRGERAAVTAQGYLTAGIAQRLADLDAALLALVRLDPGPRDRVSPGALVQLVDDAGAERWLLVVPGALGDALPLGGHTVTTLSPEAPLARALWGLEEGDDTTFRDQAWTVEQVG
jgi:transcription elongation GreA/GreB family factor